MFAYVTFLSRVTVSDYFPMLWVSQNTRAWGTYL